MRRLLRRVRRATARFGRPAARVQSRCHVVGDKRSDIECGLAAGVNAILVGRAGGAYRPDALDYARANGVPCFPGLPEAVDHVLGAAAGLQAARRDSLE